MALFCFGYIECDVARGHLDRGPSKPGDVWVWSSGNTSEIKIEKDSMHIDSSRSHKRWRLPIRIYRLTRG